MRHKYFEARGKNGWRVFYKYSRINDLALNCRTNGIIRLTVARGLLRASESLLQDRALPFLYADLHNIGYMASYAVVSTGGWSKLGPLYPQLSQINERILEQMEIRIFPTFP